MKTNNRTAQRIERTFGILLASAGLALVVFDPAILLLIITAVPLAAASMVPLFM